MTPTELKAKYPNASKMIDNLTIPREGGYFLHEFSGDKTIADLEGGKFYYNYQGIHQRVFPDLETLVKWFEGTDEEQEEAEGKIKNYGYNSYLSELMGEEVNTDDDGNVGFCDFTNDDFTPEQLAKARLED